MMAIQKIGLSAASKFVMGVYNVLDECEISWPGIVPALSHTLQKSIY